MFKGICVESPDPSPLVLVMVSPMFSDCILILALRICSCSILKLVQCSFNIYERIRRIAMPVANGTVIDNIAQIFKNISFSIKIMLFLLGNC